jgi:hypothetical protein
VPPLRAVGRANKPGDPEVARKPRTRSGVLPVAARSGSPWPAELSNAA